MKPQSLSSRDLLLAINRLRKKHRILKSLQKTFILIIFIHIIHIPIYVATTHVKSIVEMGAMRLIIIF